MEANNILGFPQNKIVRRFENQTIPKPSNEKDIELLADLIMENINSSINALDMGDVVDDIAFKEYCLVQQAVMSMVKKIYDENDHHLQEFADYYIDVKSEMDDGTMVYTAAMPSLAFLSEDGTDYTIINFEEEE